jgi:hypothetical protein
MTSVEPSITSSPAPEAVVALRGLIDRFASGPAVLAAALEGITAAELDHRPAPGEWTARENVHHLADAEANAFVRLRQLLSHAPDYTVQAWDQDAWAAAPALAYDRPLDSSLALFAALRASSLELLRRLIPDDLALAGTHPEIDRPYSVGLWLRLVADHPYDHADQIRRARATAS